MLPGTLIGVTATARDFEPSALRSDRLLTNADFISLQTYNTVCTKQHPYPNCQLERMRGDLKPGVFQQKALETIQSSGVLQAGKNKKLIGGLPDYDMNADPNIMGELNMYDAAKATICRARSDPALSTVLVGDSYWSRRPKGGVGS